MKKLLSFMLCAMICTCLSAQDRDVFKHVKAHKSAEKIRALLQSGIRLPHNLAKKADGNVIGAVDFNWDNGNNAWSADTNAVYSYVWKSDNTVDSMVRLGETSRTVHKDYVALDIDFQNEDFPISGLYPSIVENQTWDMTSNSWIPTTRERLESTAGRLEGGIFEMFDGNSWIGIEKTDFTYDSLGSFTGLLSYEWDADTFVLYSGFRFKYTYNSSGHITGAVVEDFFDGEWEEDGAEQYLLNSDGSIHTALKGAYYNDTFYVSDSMLITWQSFEARPSINMLAELYDLEIMVGGYDYDSFTVYSEDWPNGMLEYERGKITYNSSGLRIKEVRDNYYDNVWNNDEMNTWDYYPTGELKSKLELNRDTDHWDTSQFQIVNILRDSEDDIYTIENIIRFYNNGSYSSTFGTKTIFEYGPQTGLAPRAGMQALEVYPNPASSVIYLNTPDENNTVQIEVRDLTGREVLKTMSATGKGIAVDISTVASGNYIITVNTGSRIYYAKLFKQ